jgi:hypothetical protein
MKTVILVACAFVAISLRAEHTLVSQEVFREDARLAVIDTATKVEACILGVQDPSRGADLNRRTFVEGRYKPLPEEIRTLIIWKLLDDRSYTWDSVPACIPTYNARVRFTAAGRTVDVDFCFGCSQVRVLERGSVVGGGYFEPGSDWVFRALATQFPKDPVIRQVKKEREGREVNRLAIEMAKAREARKERANQAPEPTR